MAKLNESPTPTEAPAAEAPKPVEQPKRAGALAIAKQALEALGAPAHHTAIQAKAQELGINPNDTDVVTPVWSDTKRPRKDGEAPSEFAFYGRSVYGLASWPKPTEDQVKAAAPARQPGGRAATPEALKAKIASLEAQLTATRDQLAKLQTA